MYTLKDSLYLEESLRTPISSEIRETYHFEIVKSMKGANDFSQTVDVQQGDTIDYVLKQTYKKNTVTMTILFRRSFTEGVEYTAYSKFNDFKRWYGKYVDMERYKMTLIMGFGNGTSANDSPYDGGVTDTLYGLRADVYVQDLKFADFQTGGTITATLTLQCLGPSYVASRKIQAVHASGTTKHYEYTYPFSYGQKTSTSADLISNQFFQPEPLKCVLIGPITNPTVALHYTDTNETTYSHVNFNAMIATGEKLVIDSENMNVYKIGTDGTTITNMYDTVDKANDVFLLAKPGDTKITLSGSDTSADWEMTVEYMDYRI